MPQNAEGFAYPVTCWMPGDTVHHRVTLPLPENAVSGAWYVSLSAFGDETLPEGRLRVRLPDGTTEGQVGLGPVDIP